MTLAYQGTRYHGWQAQPNTDTVQRRVEEVLQKLFGQRRIEVFASGRTDAGVHAKQQVVHVDLPSLSDHADLRYRMNQLLPYDIAVTDLFPVRQDAHARYDAVKRTYTYHVHSIKNPFLHQQSCYRRQAQHWDIQQLNHIAKSFLQIDDFRPFAKHTHTLPHGQCGLSLAQWTQDNEQQYRFVISAKRFLKSMVRALVGTSWQIAEKEYPHDHIRHIIQHKALPYYAPPEGLYLEKVQYEPNINLFP